MGNRKTFAAPVADSARKEPVPIWFFVGTLCLVYGLILVGVGVYELKHPPAVVLAHLHASLWWGVVLTVAGAAYSIRFWPRR